MTIKQESKRILSVKVSHEVDTDPDTSWLGEYANQPTSEFSIDRAHSEDCSQNDTAGQKRIADSIDQLERIIDYLNPQRFEDGEESDRYEVISEAQDELIQCQDKLREDAECDCGERGDMDRGQYRYFNPSFNYIDKFGAALPENTPDEVRKYVRQDYERMESLNRGSWSFLGIRAEAQIQLNGMSTIQTIQSGGLWGIESDSGADHFREVEGDELDQLKAELHAIGFSKRAITAAFRDVKRSND